MSKINYLLPIALLASSASYATSEDTWYAGARLGGTHFSDFSAKNFPVSDLDKDDWGGGAFVGYNINKWFALEGGYTYLGETTFNNSAEIKQQAFDVVGKFTKDLSQNVDVFAKLGASRYMSEGKGSLSAYEDKNLIATAGVGLEYFFTKSISTRLEYQFYAAPELENNGFSADWDTHFYGLSLVYTWGASAAPVVAPAAQKEVVAETKAIEPPAKEEIAVATTAVVKEAVAEPVVIEPLTVQVRFSEYSAELQQQYIDQLAPIAQHLIDYPEAKLFVVGHTDSQGSEKLNQELSEQRATRVANHLANEFNIDKSRIEQEGLGESKPIATNETPEGRAENRRVSVFTPGLTVPAK